MPGRNGDLRGPPPRGWALGSDHMTDFSTIGALLEERIKPSRPYSILLWTAYPDQAPGLHRFLGERLHSVTKPSAVLPLAKANHLDPSGAVKDATALVKEIVTLAKPMPGSGLLPDPDGRVPETTPTMIEVTSLPAPEAIMQRLSRLFEKPDGPRATTPPGFPQWETTMEEWLDVELPDFGSTPRKMLSSDDEGTLALRCDFEGAESSPCRSRYRSTTHRSHVSPTAGHRFHSPGAAIRSAGLRAGDRRIRLLRALDGRAESSVSRADAKKILRRCRCRCGASPRNIEPSRLHRRRSIFVIRSVSGLSLHALPGPEYAKTDWYRAVSISHAGMPLAWRHSYTGKTRFKEARASFPLLYLAPDRFTALLEVRAFLGHPRTRSIARMSGRWHVARVDVRLDHVADLRTTNERAQIQTTVQELTGTGQITLHALSIPPTFPRRLQRRRSNL